ncbi:MAG: 2-amino-4-hydroxy-6-hydroxymethyldihydropteridine diphosphokinase [Bacteroidetes bacterium]|nr:2-amino-4-hydroxy-6-hydroxymethyldihydropteridine diphosphokinase [Bacteroidota bacterium]
MARVFIGLGSNVGNRAEYLQKALIEIANSEKISLNKYSSVYETEPVGKKEQPQFFNMTAELESKLSSRDLLNKLKEIESSIGRTKRERWGPREIDIDILYYGDEILNEKNLQLPHPEIARRRFVLVPMNEIDAEFIDPMRCESIKDLLKRCSDTSAVRKVKVQIDIKKV